MILMYNKNTIWLYISTETENKCKQESHFIFGNFLYILKNPTTISNFRISLDNIRCKL